jgi:hypothetical protein
MKHRDEIRPIVEILKVILKAFENTPKAVENYWTDCGGHLPLVFNGICQANSLLYSAGLLDYHEETMLRQYLYQHTCSEAKLANGGYWWPKLETQPRIDWLKNEIKSLGGSLW